MEIHGIQVASELKVPVLFDDPDAIYLYRACGGMKLPITVGRGPPRHGSVRLPDLAGSSRGCLGEDCLTERAPPRGRVILADLTGGGRLDIAACAERAGNELRRDITRREIAGMGRAF